MKSASKFLIQKSLHTCINYAQKNSLIHFHTPKTFDSNLQKKNIIKSHVQTTLQNSEKKIFSSIEKIENYIIRLPEGKKIFKLIFLFSLSLVSDSVAFFPIEYFYDVFFATPKIVISNKQLTLESMT